MADYRVFSSMEDLFAFACEEKHWDGEGSTTLNRYPVRFVLFENFADFNEFVNGIDDAFAEHVYVQGISKWLDADYPDAMLTQDDLGKYVVGYIKKLPSHDFVFAPFSELARFYDNEKYHEFNSLISTIRLAEPPLEAQQNHQRIYIPIIGMQGKMGAFNNDPNIHIWEYKTPSPQPSYELVLTKGSTYGVQGLEETYSTVGSVKEWLDLWCQENPVSQRIICSSKAIFNNAHNAMPDNAFTYCICKNAFEFITKGLRIDFGDVAYKEEDNEFWETLASEIDITDFNFDTFVGKRFDTFGITNGVSFIKTWFDCDTAFDRWLLSIYYQKKFDKSDYLFRALAACESLNTSSLMASLATLIFSESFVDSTINERKALLLEVAKHKATMPEEAENFVKARLQAIAADPEKSYYTAAKLLTPSTSSERDLTIQWFGSGRINENDVKSIFPELIDYCKPLTVQSDVDWIGRYFNEYRKSKLANSVTDELAGMLQEVNGSPAKFANWQDEFKTTRTILAHREDIDVIYWIDGLGVDWVPLITSIIEAHKFDGIYLNEIYIATSKLPTRTSNNKAELQQLTTGELPKIGDLDSFAHTNKEYPSYISNEIKIVTDAIEKVLATYSGKKIAFVSDHGISYMPQLAQGLQLTGYESDHGGRCAVRTTGTPSTDNNYIILDDGKTICSLNHSSLTSKINKGQGAHGGALPEEVLVPIIIVSSQKNANNYTSKLLTPEVSAAAPVVRVLIKGLPSVDTPQLIYNGIPYTLKKVGPDTYESERLNLVDSCKSVKVAIGASFNQSFPISVQTGAEEDDLFGDL